MNDDMYDMSSYAHVKLFVRLRVEIEEAGEWKVRMKRKMKYC